MRFRTVPKTSLRDRLKDELGPLGDEALVITQRGRAIAIVITAQRSNRLQDELDELRAEARLAGEGPSKKDWLALIEEGDRRVGRPPSWG